MKKFRFRLESLKKIKEHTEKQRQKEHAVALTRVIAQKRNLSEIESRRLGVMESQRTKHGQPGVMSPSEMLSYSRYYLRLKREQIAGTEILRGLESEAEIRRQKLVEASRERKTLDKLKERQLEKYRQETERTLSKENDEISANTARMNTIER